MKDAMPKSDSVIKQFVTEASIDSLNSALAEHGVPPKAIVAIHYLPRKALAIGDYEAEYHVLYWSPT